MLSNFTWWQFFGTFLLFCAIYYPCILWLCYKPSLQRLVQKLGTGYASPEVEDTLPAQTADTRTDDTTIPEAVVATNLSQLMTTVQEDIRSGIKAARDANASKDQLRALLKNILLKYPELKQPGEQVRINEFLVQECAKANYSLFMAEAYALWPTDLH